MTQRRFWVRYGDALILQNGTLAWYGLSRENPELCEPQLTETRMAESPLVGVAKYEAFLRLVTAS